MKKLLTAALIFSLFSFSGCGKEEGKSTPQSSLKAQEKSSSSPSSKEESKDLAYDFSFTDVNGKVHRLSDYRGKVVIVQFFGTYCPPCRAEIPVLEKLYNKYAGKLVVIGLSVDYTGQPPQKLKPFAQEMGITYPIGPAPEDAWNNYAGKITQMDSIPQTFIIDKKGRLRYYEVGFTPSYESLFDKAVNELLKE
ncbi:TlpA family protein disulfide reductase [Thermovibrio sp.]